MINVEKLSTGVIQSVTPTRKCKLFMFDKQSNNDAGVISKEYKEHAIKCYIEWDDATIDYKDAISLTLAVKVFFIPNDKVATLDRQISNGGDYIQTLDDGIYHKIIQVQENFKTKWCRVKAVESSGEIGASIADNETTPIFVALKSLLSKCIYNTKYTSDCIMQGYQNDIDFPLSNQFIIMQTLETLPMGNIPFVLNLDDGQMQTQAVTHSMQIDAYGSNAQDVLYRFSNAIRNSYILDILQTLNISITKQFQPIRNVSAPFDEGVYLERFVYRFSILALNNVKISIPTIKSIITKIYFAEYIEGAKHG